MLLHSAYDASDAYIPDLGYQLSLPYFQAAARSGWTPWNSPYGYQQFYSPYVGGSYGGYNRNQPFGYNYGGILDQYGRGYTPGMVLKWTPSGSVWARPGWFID